MTILVSERSALSIMGIGGLEICEGSCRVPKNGPSVVRYFICFKYLCKIGRLSSKYPANRFALLFVDQALSMLSFDVFDMLLSMFGSKSVITLSSCIS